MEALLWVKPQILLKRMSVTPKIIMLIYFLWRKTSEAWCLRATNQLQNSCLKGKKKKAYAFCVATVGCLWHHSSNGHSASTVTWLTFWCATERTVVFLCSLAVLLVPEVGRGGTWLFWFSNILCRIVERCNWAVENHTQFDSWYITFQKLCVLLGCVYELYKWTLTKTSTPIFIKFIQRLD